MTITFLQLVTACTTLFITSVLVPILLMWRQQALLEQKIKHHKALIDKEFQAIADNFNLQIKNLKEKFHDDIENFEHRIKLNFDLETTHLKHSLCSHVDKIKDLEHKIIIGEKEGTAKIVSIEKEIITIKIRLKIRNENDLETT